MVERLGLSTLHDKFFLHADFIGRLIFCADLQILSVD
jgi:hypothetical protein